MGRCIKEKLGESETQTGTGAKQCFTGQESKEVKEMGYSMSIKKEMKNEVEKVHTKVKWMCYSWLCVHVHVFPFLN